MTKWLLQYSLHESMSDKVFVTFGLLKALALAGFTWWLCGFSMWLWNRRFKLRMVNHILCALAALVTLLAIFSYSCLGELNSFALRRIQAWEQGYTEDRVFLADTNERIRQGLQEYYRLHDLAWPSGDWMPWPDHEEAKLLIVSTYGERTIEHLMLNEPLLGRIIWKDTHINVDPLRAQMDDFFQSRTDRTERYKSIDCAKFTGQASVERLNTEVSRQTAFLRWKLLGLFLLAQFVAFALAGYSAYNDLKLR